MKTKSEQAMYDNVASLKAAGWKVVLEKVECWVFERGEEVAVVDEHGVHLF